MTNETTTPAAMTVLLPVYNAGVHLAQAIQSVLDQDFTAFEFIIIDDASKDNSAETILRFAQRDSRIRFIRHEKNQGLAATLNEGLTLAQAPLVARMDQDDESLPSRFTTQLAFMNANPEVAACGSYVFHMGKTRARDRLITLPTDAAAIRTTLTSYNCLYHPSVMLRRARILSLGGYRKEFKNAEDYDLWLRASRVFPLANIPEPLLRYRFSVKGMTLGRKWEQYYYVCLAQVADENPTLSIEALGELATKRRDTYQRSWFMDQVYEGTIKDLLHLHHWWDAIILSRRRMSDVSLKSGMKSLGRVFQELGRELCGRHAAQPLQSGQSGAAS